MAGIHAGFIGRAGAAASGPLTATLTSTTAEAHDFSSGANAIYEVNLNGKVYASIVGAGTPEFETWRTGGGLSSDFQLRATRTGGSGTASGTFGTWSALSSTRTYSLFNGDAQTAIDVFITMEIRRTSDLVVVATASISMSARNGDLV